MMTMSRDIQPDPLKEYIVLAGRCQENLERSLRDYAGVHADSARAIDTLSGWITELESRPEYDMLDIAVRELRFGLLACSQGQYRQAYMGLRMAIELSVAAIHFSSREIDLREWQAGDVDIRWSVLIDEKEGGVFSGKFVKACAPTLQKEGLQMKGIAITLYRECSDFVHGSAKSASALPDALAFDETLLKRWHTHLNIALTPIVFALLVRHGRYPAIITTPAARKAVRAILSGIGPAIALVDAAEAAR